jgi:hypothetical protein
MIIIGIIGFIIVLFIIMKIVDLRSPKLENEEKKEEYLINRFKDEIKDLKNDEISGKIEVEKPWKLDKPWRVYKVTDRGYMGSTPFKTQFKQTHLLDILDTELDELIKKP